MLDAPQAMLDERSRLGLDGRDEMWDGVLHMVPAPGGWHQRLSSKFLIVVGPQAEHRGLIPMMETGLYRADNDWRVPDQLYCLPEQFSDRGAEGAELVVEYRSPRDETYQKMDFYAAVGVREMIVIHPDDRRVELYVREDSRLIPARPDAEGGFRSEVLGVRLVQAAGKLRVTWDGGSADI